MISFLHLCLLCLIPFVCMASKLELKNVFLDAQIQSMMIYREDQGMYHPIGRISDLKPIVEHPTGYETSSTVIYAHEEYIGKFQGAIHEEVTLTVQGLTTDNAFLSMVECLGNLSRKIGAFSISRTRNKLIHLIGFQPFDVGNDFTDSDKELIKRTIIKYGSEKTQFWFEQFSQVQFQWSRSVLNIYKPDSNLSWTIYCVNEDGETELSTHDESFLSSNLGLLCSFQSVNFHRLKIVRAPSSQPINLEKLPTIRVEPTPELIYGCFTVTTIVSPHSLEAFGVRIDYNFERLVAIQGLIYDGRQFVQFIFNSETSEAELQQFTMFIKGIHGYAQLLEDKVAHSSGPALSKITLRIGIKDSGTSIGFGTNDLSIGKAIETRYPKLDWNQDLIILENSHNQELGNHLHKLILAEIPLDLQMKKRLVVSAFYYLFGPYPSKYLWDSIYRLALKTCNGKLQIYWIYSARNFGGGINLDAFMASSLSLFLKTNGVSVNHLKLTEINGTSMRIPKKVPNQMLNMTFYNERSKVLEPTFINTSRSISEKATLEIAPKIKEKYRPDSTAPIASKAEYEIRNDTVNLNTKGISSSEVKVEPNSSDNQTLDIVKVSKSDTSFSESIRDIEDEACVIKFDEMSGISSNLTIVFEINAGELMGRTHFLKDLIQKLKDYSVIEIKLGRFNRKQEIQINMRVARMLEAYEVKKRLLESFSQTISNISILF